VHRLKRLLYQVLVTITTVTLVRPTVGRVRYVLAFGNHRRHDARIQIQRGRHQHLQFGNFSGPDFFGPLFDTALPLIGQGQAP